MTGSIRRSGKTGSGPRRLVVVALAGMLALAAIVVACGGDGASDGDDAVSTRSASSGGFAVGAPDVAAVEPSFAPSAPPN